MAHTSGPWVWLDRYTLRPANPNPSASAIHTILSSDGCCGFRGSELRDTLAEDEANRELIAAAPILFDAIEFTLRTAKLDRVTEMALRQALAAATVVVPEGVAT